MTDDVHPAATRREWVGLAVLALPTMLLGLDLTVLHLAVPQLSADLQPSSTQLLWITDIYGFLIAGFLITMGTLGDRIGRRKLLLTGAAAFGLASVIAAFSVNAEMLIATRALLGVAGATLMPSTLSLIRNMFHDPSQRRFAIAVWMTNFMVGGAIGPLVGGVLLERYWWGSVFLLGVPVMALLLALGPVLLPEYRDTSAGRLDPPSVLLLLGSVLAIIYGFKELAKGVHEGGLLIPAAAVVVGLGIGVVFVRRQRWLPDPVLDLALLARRQFSVALGTQTMALFVIAGIQFLILQYLQLVLGLSALRAGLWTLPAMVFGVLGTLLAPRLARWMRHGVAISLTLTLALVGLVLITQAGGEHSLPLVVAGFTILSLGVNPAMALTTDTIVGTAPPERAGAASGMSETGSEFGLAFGVAVVGSVGTAIYRGQVTGERLGADIPPGVLETARDTLGGALAVSERLPAAEAAQLLAVTRDAFTQGLQVAAVINAAILVILAVLAFGWLRPTSAGETPPEPLPHADDDHERDESVGVR